jgi:glutathione S-transferase
MKSLVHEQVGSPDVSRERVLPTLYFSPGACSLAPHIVLEEIGRPYQLALASTSDGTTRSPEYLRLNPKGRVPVLVTGESVLTEAPAILVHLALNAPELKLIASTNEGLVRTLEWFNWLSGAVHSVAIRQVRRPQSFSADASQHASIVALGKESLASAFALIEERLAGLTWFIEDRYTVLDPYLLVFHRWGHSIGFDMANNYPRWTAHTHRVVLRPASTSALLQEKIAPWTN